MNKKEESLVHAILRLPDEQNVIIIKDNSIKNPIGGGKWCCTVNFKNYGEDPEVLLKKRIYETLGLVLNKGNSSIKKFAVRNKNTISKSTECFLVDIESKITIYYPITIDVSPLNLDALYDEVIYSKNKFADGTSEFLNILSSYLEHCGDK